MLNPSSQPLHKRKIGVFLKCFTWVRSLPPKELLLTLRYVDGKPAGCSSMLKVKQQNSSTNNR